MKQKKKKKRFALFRNRKSNSQKATKKLDKIGKRNKINNYIMMNWTLKGRKYIR